MSDNTRRLPDASRELRSFGRKRGRKISVRQKRLIDDLLPNVSVQILDSAINANALFGNDIQDIWLEIGFGGAEHLIWQAEHHPGVGFIGCEPFEEGVVKALSAIEAKRLTNIRLYDGDARDILRRLPNASIGRVFILFPDPWPKRRHVKRRLVSAATFDMTARVMRSGAQLRVATDIGDYARTILIAAQSEPRLRWLARTAGDWRQRTDDWPQTRYEQKALREGRRPYFLTFARVPD